MLTKKKIAETINKKIDNVIENVFRIGNDYDNYYDSYDKSELVDTIDFISKEIIKLVDDLNLPCKYRVDTFDGYNEIIDTKYFFDKEEADLIAQQIEENNNNDSKDWEDRIYTYVTKIASSEEQLQME